MLHQQASRRKFLKIIVDTAVIAIMAPCAWGASLTSAKKQGVPLKRASVLDFGAVGNGISDDTISIQLAITSAAFVYLPHGSYLVTDQINVPSDKIITGDGIGKTKILFKPEKSSRVFTCINASRVEISNISFFQINTVESCYAILAYLTANIIQSNL